MGCPCTNWLQHNSSKKQTVINPCIRQAQCNGTMLIKTNAQNYDKLPPQSKS